MNMNRRYHSSLIKKDKIIDLTDTGRRNKTSVVRDTQDDFMPAKVRSLNDAPTPPSRIITVVDEDKDLGRIPQGPNLVDPDSQFEEQLEAGGATIISSETYFPASRTTITKRSMKPEEHRAEQDRAYYLER
jgi:hypothetical protein